MMWSHGIGLALGVAAGNIALYRWLWGREWADAIGIGCTAGVITLALIALLRWFQS